MKTLCLMLAATMAVASYTYAQTPAAPAASSPPASSKDSHPHLGHACKEEVKKLCGRAHGQEMQDCVKSGLDLNKFSADCKTELTKSAKPSG